MIVAQEAPCSLAVTIQQALRMKTTKHTRLFSPAPPRSSMNPAAGRREHHACRSSPSQRYPTLCQAHAFAAVPLLRRCLCCSQSAAIDQVCSRVNTFPSYNHAEQSRNVPMGSVRSGDAVSSATKRLTTSTDSAMKFGRLKKNLDRSKMLRVVRSFAALAEFSRTGKNTWSAFCDPSVHERLIVCLGDPKKLSHL